MASILDRYGIKEVADVTFYTINGSTGAPNAPALYLDTLKVSTIETTAEETYAQGGKGNARLIGWDFNKEITLTLQDALFSAKSLAIMFGAAGNIASELKCADWAPKSESDTASDAKHFSNLIMRTRTFVAESSDMPSNEIIIRGKTYTKLNQKVFDDAGHLVTGSLSKDTKYFESFDLEATDVAVITINADTFSENYYITGDTYIKNETSGEDEFFQFVVPKAKISSDVTLTLEAEGDPTVFDMTVTVLRPDDGNMMKLIKYKLDSVPGEGAEDTNWYHAQHLTGLTESSDSD